MTLCIHPVRVEILGYFEVTFPMGANFSTER